MKPFEVCPTSGGQFKTGAIHSARCRAMREVTIKTSESRINNLSVGVHRYSAIIGPREKFGGGNLMLALRFQHGLLRAATVRRSIY